MIDHHRPLLTLVLLGAVLTGAPAQAQPDDLDAWIAVESRHFTIWTDADPERAGEIARSLELFRSVFARLAPALELRSPAPTKILAFRDARSFAPYKTRADQGGATVLGQFLSHPDGNYLMINAGTHLVSSFTVIYHEYVHYFVRHNFPGVPLWFNEGLAEYYSTFAVEGETIHVGRPVERHIRFLQRDPEFSLSDVLEVTRGSSDYHEGRKAGRFYAVSWALVHFLLSGGSERLDQMADFLIALEDGDDAWRAFENAFGARLSTLEEELRAYLLAGELPSAAFDVSAVGSPGSVRASRPAPADVLFQLGDLLAHSGRRQQAEDHFQTALDYDPEHPESHAGLALVRDLGGRFEEAAILYRDAVPASDDALTYLLYGRHLLQRAQRPLGGTEGGQHSPIPGEEPGQRARLVAEARDVLARAMELDANYAEAHVLFGAAHRVGEVDPGPGIAALEKARAWLPGRHDVSLHLIQLYLKNREYGRAEAVLAADLEGLPDMEMAWKAREEIDRARLIHEAQQALEDGEAERAAELYDEAISVTSDPDLRQQMEERLHRMREQIGAY